MASQDIYEEAHTPETNASIFLDEIIKFLYSLKRKHLRKGMYTGFETEEHIVIVVKANMKGAKSTLTAFATYLFTLASLQSRRAMWYSSILRIIAVNKKYFTPDALCSLYGSRTRKRLECVGRENIVKKIIEYFNPNTVVLPYDPSNITSCSSLYKYYPTYKWPLYLCIR